ncbi:type ISP restriction/modification enzyme [Micromonospora parva]|uniref:type ISP restriction/modification enzyme n=1 Tax=Micromonospora parva TaxID=1464048 RepID=UPI0036682711
MKQLFPESSRGVTAGRTWIYSPDADTLGRRWRRFTQAGESLRRRMLPESRDRKLDTVVRPLPGMPEQAGPLVAETGPAPTAVRVAYRSFDRQWVLPDSRLMVMPRPPLWAVRSPHQIYLTEQNSQPIDSGPGVTFTQLIPDLHHYNGRSGRVFPLYCDTSTERPNIAPGLCAMLAETFGTEVAGADVMAYVAAVTAHPGYTERFRQELQHPGVRVPLTADANSWAEAVSIGREVLWLHTFGQISLGECPISFRDFVDEAAPRVKTAIPDEPGALPDSISWRADSETLLVGNGRIAPVHRRVWEYDVGGMRVLRHWFNYRCAHQRHRHRSSPLDDEGLNRWSSDLTDELLEILAVLGGCVAAEPRQLELLDRICTGRLISVAALAAGGVLPVQGAAKLTTVDEGRIPRLF